MLVDLLATALALLPLRALAAPNFSRQSASNTVLAQTRAKAVKSAFETAWAGYYKYAFPHDELHPVSNSFSDSRNGWGASAVDAFTTAIVMELPEIIDTILITHIPHIDFNSTTEQISLFETTIRYLGGMLAGYDLLSGPFSKYASNQTQQAALADVLKQATRLANNLAFGFNTPSGVPSNNLYINGTTDGSNINGLATAGSLVLEWTRLSDLTGDPLYAKLSQKGESYLLDPHPLSSEPFPGLVGTNINVTNGNFLDDEGGWNGGDDSFYEYLLKMYIYDPKRFATYKDRWILAADSTIKYLASHPSTRPDLTFVAAYDGQQLVFSSSHLACFNGGNFILGGLVLKEQKYIDFGLALVNGCEDTYAQDLTGIGPEAFSWVTNTTALDDTVNPQPPLSQLAFYDKAGFYVTNSQYILRPEVLESFYYAYRATGDQKYRDWSWNGFVNINKTCRVGSGYAEVMNINAPHGGGFNDFQDSFFFAEVLKYAFAIHMPDADWQVDSKGNNKFVFNTEAHPFKVAGPIDY